ncbi:hypothetical protein [Olleya namhaensis]|nr:hypothetical protein [Olleya namhaensis]
MAGLQNSDAFQFEMHPITSPKHLNFNKFVSTGNTTFTGSCND